MTHDHTPQLPDIFPQGEIKVEEEAHRYQTFEGDSGSVLEKTEYTLDKAPIDNITKVTGIYNGQTITFTSGTDYSLQDLVRNQQNDFTFLADNGPYMLDDAPDTGSTVVTDASGDSYTEGTDYEIFNPDDIEADTLRWLDGGSSPDDGEDFTVKFTVTFTNSIIKWDTTERTPDAGSIFYVSYRCDSVISRYIEGADEQFNNIEDELNAIIEGKFVDSAEGQELDEIGKVFGVLGKRSGRSDTQYRIYLKSVVQSFVSRGTVNGIKLAISAATEVPLEDITINEDFQDNEYEVVVIPQTPVDGNLLEQVAEIADPSGVNQSRTRFTPAPDEMQINDSVKIALADTLAVEDMTVTDTAVAFNSDTFEDVLINETVQIDPNKFTVPDQMSANDTPAIDANKNTVSDDATANDSNAINANKTTTLDDATADDTVASTRAEASESATSNDTTATAQTTVTWDDGNWDSMNWATEHN